MTSAQAHPHPAHPHPTVPGLFARLSRRFDTSPNRIALSYALRGTVAIALPLFLLPPIGLGAWSHLVVIGALQTSIVDVGGPYGGRLRGMVANSIVSPLLLLIGTGCGVRWWVAGLAMGLVALAGGLMRALGQGATTLGVTFGVALLIGIELQLPPGPAAAAALAYGAGGAWTILVALVVWRLRPYKRLEQEVGGIWEELAALTALLGAPARSLVARHQQEQLLAERQRSLRDAIERALAALGEARGEISGAGAAMAHLLVLLRAAARIGIAETALAVAYLHPADHRAALTPATSAAIRALEAACRGLAGLLMRGRGSVPLDAYRQCVRNLLGVPGPDAEPGRRSALLSPFAMALRQLEAAEDAAEGLFGTDHRIRGLLPPLEPAASLRTRLGLLRAHLSPSSLIFRHALRVALSAGIATAIMVWFAVPHGIWLPLTALVVPQPEFGGTMRRAFDRSLGTLGGAVLAAILLYVLRGTIAFEIAIVILGFGTFLLLRRKYGFAIVFLTVLIMLLLGLTDPDPWIDIRDRVVDTVCGAAVALATGYLLWPQWEHERLRPRLQEALRANGAYLTAALARLAGTGGIEEILAQRRQAEIATGNAEAAFQRMLAEPRAQRRNIGRAFALITHVRRLNRHISALVAHLETDPARSRTAQELAAALTAGLGAAVAALAETAPVAAFAVPEATVVRVRQELAEAAPAHDSPGSLVGRIASDVSALHATAVNR